MSKPVILTGLRANSQFHLGNYLGGILPMIELQQKYAGQYQINMFVPDLHSFTTPIDHSQLYRQTIDNLRVFVAAGLDTTQPDTYLYRQSAVPAHSELTWILSCFTGVGELRRMTQYKDKSGIYQLEQETQRLYGEMGARGRAAAYTAADRMKKLEEWKANDAKTVPIEAYEELLNYRYPEQDYNARIIDHFKNLLQTDERSTAGLFTYPVLMAADILLYNAEWIPVGEDQMQHIELTRDLAQRLNHTFGQELFTVPHEWKKQLEFASRDNGVRIRSLRNPDKKMSKSVADPAGTISLFDTPDEAHKKIMSATTDSVGVINLDWTAQSGISNLLQISALLADQPLSNVAETWQGQTSYGDLKKQVAGQVSDFLTKLQATYAATDETAILHKLETDEERMRVTADATLRRVQQAVGLRA